MRSLWLTISMAVVLSCSKSYSCDELYSLDIRKQSKQIINLCVKATYSNCKASKANLTLKELKEIKNLLWSNSLLRNDNLGGSCFERASIISKLLDNEGFKSEKILLRSNILTPHRTSKGFSAIYYQVHIANIITIEESPGKFGKYVLDPMFLDEPMPMEKYVKMVSTNNTPQPTSYELVSQTYEVDPSSYEFGPLAESIESCRNNPILIEMNKKKLQKNLDSLEDSDDQDRVTFDSWERAKLAYQFFYEIPFNKMPKISESQIEDALKTSDNIPADLPARAQRRQSIRKILREQ